MAEHTPIIGFFFPWTMLIALLIAIVFAAIGVLVFRKGLSKAEKPIDPKIAEFTSAIWGGPVRAFFARYGYFPTDALSQSFVKALKVLQSFIGGYEFRYQIPWYMIVGSEGSGKSSLLNSLDLNLPVGRPHFGKTDEAGEKQECDWWFYDHGVVLDIAGDLFLEEGHIGSDESKWDILLNLISHHRPKRPLDGLILTVSSEDLMGRGKLSYDELRLRAEYVYLKLWQLQRKTGLRLPVYIVVTKCDKISGFQQFCSAMPKGREKDIFGWSNESALDTTYEPKWIEEAFEGIKLSLYRIQQNIFAAGKTYTNLDGIFKFPFEFDQMRESLQTYVNHVFKTSGYHEGYFLRGIYFTGDGGGTVGQAAEKERSAKREKELQALLEVETDIFDEVAEHPALRPAALKTDIFFIDDLFERRIFCELGLARPVSSVLLGNTSAMRVAKIGVASGTVVATLGLLNAADNLSKSKDNIMPALVQINETLSQAQSQSLSTQTGALYFQQQTEVLLTTMGQVHSNRLTSAFIPASWFSSVDNDITEVMATAFNEVIFKSMSRELTSRANDLVMLSSHIPVHQEAKKNGDPLQTEAFFTFRNYVYQVHALALTAERFNNIGITSSIEDVADIIYYLFKVRMPEEFFKNDQYYQRALQTTKVRVFDFEEFQPAAVVKLRKLYNQFQAVAFNPDTAVPGLRKLSKGLQVLESSRNLSSYNVGNLREITKALSLTVSSLSGPAVQWIDLENFSPGIAYDHVMSTVSGSPLLGAGVTSEMTSESAANFHRFKLELASYKSPLMNGSLFEKEGSGVLAKPTVGATKLLGLLNLFYSEKFMAKAADTSILTQVPEGSVVMWDSLRLQQGIELISDHSKFMNVKLLSFPKKLQPMLAKVASESLVANLNLILADAEVFTGGGTSSYTSAPEDALLAQVQNYRATATDLEKILFVLHANGGTVAYSRLRKVLLDQNYKLLIRLDQILESDQPYAIKDNSFVWWAGENMASFEAFSVSSLPELKGYLELQRGRIRYLAMEFAAPVVSLLTKINKQGRPGDMPLISKWTNIISELEGYHKKHKGNGLSALEEYIEDTLNEITLNTCNKYASTLTPVTTQNSYFVGILNNIRRDVTKQCQALADFVSTNTYSTLSDYFNANLAGRYPFVPVDTFVGVPDVDAEELRGFFDLMDDKAASIKATLQQAAESLGSAGHRALQFIEDMDAVRKFFGGFLAKASKMPYPQFDFTVDFRVNRKAEKAGNQVVDWFVDVQNTKIDFRSKGPAGHWNLGDPIAVSLRWAANSPEQPQSSSTNPALNVFNGMASFSYGGKWGLIRLLRDQAAPLSDFASPLDNQPQTLAFDVPLVDLLGSGQPCPESAKVFIRLKVKPIEQSIDKKTGAVSFKPGREVVLPNFPAKAPRLSGV